MQKLLCDNYILKVEGYSDLNQFWEACKAIYQEAEPLRQKGELQGKTITKTATQTKLIADCTGPSWSHFSQQVTKETKVSITFLAKNISEKKLSRDIEYIWLKGDNIKFATRFYAGHCQIS